MCLDTTIFRVNWYVECWRMSFSRVPCDFKQFFYFLVSMSLAMVYRFWLILASHVWVGLPMSLKKCAQRKASYAKSLRSEIFLSWGKDVILMLMWTLLCSLWHIADNWWSRMRRRSGEHEVAFSNIAYHLEFWWYRQINTWRIFHISRMMITFY